MASLPVAVISTALVLGAVAVIWSALLYLVLFFATLHLVDRLAHRKPPGENE